MSYFDDISFSEAGAEPGCRRSFDMAKAQHGLVFAKSGKLRLSIDDRQPKTLDAPLAFWHHPAHRYRYGCADAGAWARYWVYMQGPRAVRIVEQGLMPLSEAGYVAVRRAEVFADAFARLVDLVQQGSVRTHPEAVLALESLVVMLWKEWYGEKPGRRRAQMEQVARRLGSDPYRDYDFHQVAEDVHVSYRHFCRLFKRHLGHSPHQYLLVCRMRKAAAQLLSEDRPVKAIARDAGYHDPAQFSKLFKKKIGMSPQQFREYGLRV